MNLSQVPCCAMLMFVTELLRGGRQSSRSMVNTASFFELYQPLFFRWQLHPRARHSWRNRFWPGTFRLHMRDGDKSNGDSGCDPQRALKPLTTYKVKIQLRDKWVALYINDEQVCIAARQDRAKYKNAIVYAADPCVRNL